MRGPGGPRPLPLPPGTPADPVVCGGGPAVRAGRRQCSSSGSWAWALAARPCVTGQAVPTAARPAERTVGVGSTGSPSGTPVEARRGGAARQWSWKQRRGLRGAEAAGRRGGSAEPAPRPGASELGAWVGRTECGD